jgi:UDP-sulfoquinovose synthase
MKIFLAVSFLSTAASFSVTTSRSAVTATSSFALHAEANGAAINGSDNSSNKKKKKVMILGGDGFCGWPTSLYLSDQGHDVVIVDNLSRRKIDVDLGCDSLTPIQPMEVRCQAWKEVSGKVIKNVNLDVAKDYDLLVQLIKQEQPDSIVHFAEQRAAPYSMKNSQTKRYTIDNNVGGSNNLCCAVIESEVDAHIVHLGTMGVYGYGTSGGEIPEGYIDVTLPGGRPANILHPAHPGSVYHATKCLDALLWQFYQKNDQLRITDLHQGIVWGTNTPQTMLDERLVNRFDYDGDYGTVLNRFLMQGTLGVPLTVYGTGGQTRAFIHISDTARCIELAINNPPKAGDRVEIFNQIAETRRVRDIAELVAGMTGVDVNFIPNPRQEAAENELDVSNSKFCNLGLDPITLDTGLFDEVTEVVKKYKSRCNPQKILPASFWNKKRAEECASIDPTSIKIKEEAATATPTTAAAAAAASS